LIIKKHILHILYAHCIEYIVLPRTVVNLTQIIIMMEIYISLSSHHRKRRASRIDAIAYKYIQILIVLTHRTKHRDGYVVCEYLCQRDGLWLTDYARVGRPTLSSPFAMPLNLLLSPACAGAAGRQWRWCAWKTSFILQAPENVPPFVLWFSSSPRIWELYYTSQTSQKFGPRYLKIRTSGSRTVLWD